MQPRPNALHQPPPGQHIQNTAEKILHPIPPLHLHLIERPCIRTPQILLILHHCGRHRLIDDVLGYARTGCDHENAVPHRLALPCAHNFERHGAVCGGVVGAERGGVMRCCEKRGVWAMSEVDSVCAAGAPVGLLDLEEGDGEQREQKRVRRSCWVCLQARYVQAPGVLCDCWIHGTVWGIQVEDCRLRRVSSSLAGVLQGSLIVILDLCVSFRV